MKKIFLTVMAMAWLATAANAQFVVEMKNGESRNVEGNVTFSNNGAGEWSVGDSYDAAMGLDAIEAITVAPKQEATANVGDFFYSDGTWSSTLDASKTPVGIIFWLGNPTEHDAALAAEHPGCTHGLVVGLRQRQTEWQDDYSGFEDEADMTVSEWITDNTDYAGIKSGYGVNAPINKIMGYNNTKGIEAFNDGEYGWDYEVFVGGSVDFTMSTTPAPASTSGWYSPSAKEISLLISGPFDGDIDDIGYLDEPLVANCALINSKLAEISGAVTISGVYWTSNEVNNRQAFSIQSKNGLLMETSKGGSNSLRPILAF